MLGCVRGFTPFTQYRTPTNGIIMTSDKWESLEEWLKAVYYARKYGVEDPRLKRREPPPDIRWVERIEPDENEVSPFVELANEEPRTDAPVLWTWSRLMERTIEIWHRKE